MRVIIDIGPDAWASACVQRSLADKRDKLKAQGILFPRSLGKHNHTRAFMALHSSVDILRYNRGFASADAQQGLRSDVMLELSAEINAAKPKCLILSAHQFGSHFLTPADIDGLHALIAPFATSVEIHAQIETPSEMALRHYAQQVLEGRARGLELELACAAQRASDWWDCALGTRPDPQPAAGVFSDVQMVPAFLDLRRWVHIWEQVFGSGTFRLHQLDRSALASKDRPKHVASLLELDIALGKAEPERSPALPSTEWLARARHFNDVLLRLLAREPHHVPRQTWRKLLGEMRVGGDPLPAAALAPIDARFAQDWHDLQDQHPGHQGMRLHSGPQDPTPLEPPFTKGFRATQYLAAALPRLEPAKAEPAHAAAPTRLATHLPAHVRKRHDELLSSSFAPHNELGHVNEEDLAAPYAPIDPRKLPQGSSGRVIVGCMKNEAPYILEWVAYHRAIGFDHFLIYTNGCDDQTVDILERLDALGIVQHRDNNNWSGKSPQQHALNAALREDVIRNAEWIAHIDVDEFINVRCGNGTVDDLLARVPDATNIAMTWRLFGHGDVAQMQDRFVIDQFESCAPRYCPKPHTVWGFKTLTRNIGAYEKLSCHRPNKLIAERAHDVRWVNGSGQDMGGDIKKNGWRNSKRSIGYDLVQLNHYALRSAESFLIKRQRGRALHVDRSIGLNYWIRMDWSGARDLTIKRNLPRLQAAFDALMTDTELCSLHHAAVAWHQDKAQELRHIPEFQDLYAQALAMQLTETERVAYALALDMET
ncbi:glycosyltransferase family 2 protein [Primorskyibacter sp. S187A]|uniref:glycosyltransferase family 2 protein n=1 Tax=Primorskyibacter sp. S187A TaxID=3415130 RepID=UPI003C797FD9